MLLVHHGSLSSCHTVEESHAEELLWLLVLGLAAKAWASTYTRSQTV